MTRAWSAYWQSGEQRGCLPGAPPAVQAALLTGWQAMARSLPRSAAVLDIATGGGAVLVAMRSARRDLKLTGVDNATLPAPPAGCQLMSGVDMVALPFADAHFAAVTSQFGIEYGPADAVAEAARVLAPGGWLRFVVHSASSVPTAHNAARLAAMRAMDEAGLFRLARQGLAGFQDRALAARIDRVRASYGNQSIVAELPMALQQAQRSGDPVRAIAAIEAKARAEMERMVAMGAAAQTAEDAGAIVDRLGSNAVLARLEAMDVPGAGPMGWVISGRKSG